MTINSTLELLKRAVHRRQQLDTDLHILAVYLNRGVPIAKLSPAQYVALDVAVSNLAFGALDTEHVDIVALSDVVANWESI